MYNLSSINFFFPDQPGVVVPEPGQNVFDPELDQLMIDAINEAQRDEEDRHRDDVQEQLRHIIDFQRRVNHIRDPNNTYLMARERVLRNGPSDFGRLTRMCPQCSALHFAVERKRGAYKKCCRDGLVTLPPLGQMPALLKNLFGGDHPHSPEFRQNTLRYNYAFQFISLEANLRRLPVGRAPPVYAIQGKVYHHLSDVNVTAPTQRYGPIYFLSPEEAINQRRNLNNRELHPPTIQIIEDLLRRVNPYAQSYMHLRNRYNAEVETIERLRADAARLNLIEPLVMPTVTLELLTVRGANNRQFDVPVVPEVAAVYNANPDNPPTPNLKVYVRDHPTRFQNVSSDSEIIDPMVFPLLFPLGERGWYIGMPHSRGLRNISLCEFYAYRLAIRDNDQRFQYAGKLTQQYIVAAYIKIEANRLRFVTLNQDKLRAESYVGLADYLNRRIRDDDEAATLGRMVILPSTFIGSARNMQMLFQDSMSIVLKHGYPSLFVTMTTNPKWQEITDNIPQGTQSNNHPMLLARVFQAKLDELMKDVLDRSVFGVAVANLYVIEFQKRGLPHAHILTILRNEDKLVDPQRIDLLINAEIPDPVTEPQLHAIVTRNMIHGPCGDINRNSPCMVDGRCSKGYPKPFSPETIMDEHGTMIYRRRDDGRTVTVVVDGVRRTLTNQWVVPYNPFLLLKFNCHINAEACATVKCVKYLYKYFFKGVDQALVQINVEHPVVDYDEVQTFLNARYMSPPEACWHINQFPMHKTTHAVIRLGVHLPQEQIVRFQPGQEVQAIRRNETTKLTAWFQLNRTDPDAWQYLYTEIPYHYVWQVCWRHFIIHT